MKSFIWRFYCRLHSSSRLMNEVSMYGDVCIVVYTTAHRVIRTQTEWPASIADNSPGEAGTRYSRITAAVVIKLADCLRSHSRAPSDARVSPRRRLNTGVTERDLSLCCYGDMTRARYWRRHSREAVTTQRTEVSHPNAISPLPLRCILE